MSALGGLLPIATLASEGPLLAGSGYRHCRKLRLASGCLLRATSTGQCNTLGYNYSKKRETI